MKTDNFVKNCSYCHRGMIVTVMRFGVSHDAGMAIICPDCVGKIDWNDKYFLDHPDETKKLKEELERSKEGELENDVEGRENV